MGLHHLTSVSILYYFLSYPIHFPYLCAIAQMITLTHLFMCLFVYMSFPQPKIFFLPILTRFNPHNISTQESFPPRSLYGPLLPSPTETSISNYQLPH